MTKIVNNIIFDIARNINIDNKNNNCYCDYNDCGIHIIIICEKLVFMRKVNTQQKKTHISVFSLNLIIVF